MYFVCLQSIILLKKSSDIDMITYGIIKNKCCGIIQISGDKFSRIRVFVYLYVMIFGLQFKLENKLFQNCFRPGC